MKILIYGHNGWIGSQMLELLLNRELDSIEMVKSESRLNNFGDISGELDKVEPTHVLNCAGLTGRPNVDWCEDHKEQVLNVNVVGTFVLASECSKRNIHLTYFGTGCIYEYDEEHTYESKGFVEDDVPNFTGSFYSKTKILTEGILKEYCNALILRIRMPLSDDLHPRNFITKITKYEKVVNIPNSMSILHDLLPIAADMLINSVTGVFNFTNPGSISHNQILDLYKQYIDNDFTYTNFSLEEQAKILKAGRSNNKLEVDKLLKLYPDIAHIQDSIIELFSRMREIESIKM